MPVKSILVFTCLSIIASSGFATNHRNSSSKNYQSSSAQKKKKLKSSRTCENVIREKAEAFEDFVNQNPEMNSLHKKGIISFNESAASEICEESGIKALNNHYRSGVDNEEENDINNISDDVFKETASKKKSSGKNKKNDSKKSLEKKKLKDKKAFFEKIKKERSSHRAKNSSEEDSYKLPKNYIPLSESRGNQDFMEAMGR